MKEKVLMELVQKTINEDVKKHSNHFSSEIMNRQIRSLIKVIAPLLQEKVKK